MIELTEKMEAAIRRGEAILYMARDGNRWFLSESGGGWVANDGVTVQFGYSSLSICQEAIECHSPYWKGVGWYRPIAFNWEDERLWCESPDEVEQLNIDMGRRFGDRPYGVEYCGSDEPPE